MDREPVVAGKFYSGSRQGWMNEVQGYLSGDSGSTAKQALLAMLPHAGYMFSGKVAGKTLSLIQLNETVLLLGPNHSGQGARLSVWPDGKWELPGSYLEVEESLANEVLNSHPRLEKNYTAHMYEHSLEVILPFLCAINKNTRFVPVCVAEPDFDILQDVGKKLGSTLKNWSNPVSIIVSSDMSHFIPSDQAKSKDELAIQAISELSPEKLCSTVRTNNISMCGVFPMTLGLCIARELNASGAELVDYANSGDVTGDYKQVVSYAGMLVY